MAMASNPEHQPSASVPDWSREAKAFWAWHPSRSLLASLRAYERLKGSSRPIDSALRRLAVLRHRFWSVVSGALRGTQVPITVLVVAPSFALLFGAIFWSSGQAWFKLDRPGRIAAVITASQKSAALGVPMLSVLAAQRNDVGLLCLPIVLYHVLQLTVAGLLAPTWKRWAEH